jgi:hypothetical protein
MGSLSDSDEEDFFPLMNPAAIAQKKQQQYQQSNKGLGWSQY